MERFCHPLLGAWARRASQRLPDALYVELASSLDLTLVTTDSRFNPVHVAEVITV